MVIKVPLPNFPDPSNVHVGKRAVDTLTDTEYVMERVDGTPTWLIARSDTVYATAAEIATTTYPQGTRVYNLTEDQVFFGDGATQGEVPSSGLDQDAVDARVALYKPVSNDTATRSGRTPPQRELVYDTDLDQLFVGDGATAGGKPVGSGAGGLVNVRAASTANVADLASVTEIDGVTLADGDSVLLKDQSSASANGVYSFDLGTTTLSRHADFASSDKFANNSVIIFVREGTQEDQLFHTDNGAFTLDSTAMDWEAYNEFTISNVTGLQAALDAKLVAANNLSDVSDTSTARSNLGLGDAAQSSTSDFLQPSNDLSDVSSTSTARTNLGLGDAAEKNTGTASGEVAAGDDSRFPTTDEKAGLAANSPTGANPVATAAELAGKEDSFSKNTAFNKNFGTGSGDVCEGNDSRLSDARTPTAHTHTLSDVTDAGDAAAKNTGTSAGTVAAGDDSRFPTTDQKAGLDGASSMSASNPAATVDEIVAKVLDAIRGTPNPHAGPYPYSPFGGFENDGSAFPWIKDGLAFLTTSEGDFQIPIGLSVQKDDGELDIEVVLADGTRVSIGDLDSDDTGLDGRSLRPGYQAPSVGPYGAEKVIQTRGF